MDDLNEEGQVKVNTDDLQRYVPAGPRYFLRVRLIFLVFSLCP